MNARIGGQKNRLLRLSGRGNLTGQQDGWRRQPAANQRPGIAGVKDHELLPLNGGDDGKELLRGERRLRFAVAQQQIHLPVIRGGEDAVRAEVEDGKIVLIRLAHRVGDGAFKRLARANRAILKGEYLEPGIGADQRGADQMQIAGAGSAQIRLGAEFGAGDQQRARGCKSAGGEQQR